MSAAKKRRELNRASEEHRRAALRAGSARHKEFLSNLAESMVMKELEKVTAQRDELLQALSELTSTVGLAIDGATGWDAHKNARALLARLKEAAPKS